MLRTQLFQQLPWVGGVNTNDDPAVIAPGQLTRGDNIVFDFRGSRKPRDGFKYNWDNVTASPNTSIYGLHEYWFGTTSKTKRFVSVNEDRIIRAYTSGGVSTVLVQGGSQWAGTLDEVSMLTFNNRCIIAVNGVNNLVKFWDGASASVEDLRNVYDHNLASSGRSSSGTTRTLKLSTSFKGSVGDYVVIHDASGPNASFYNGTYVVSTVTTTSITNDTITYTAVGSLTEGGTTDNSLVVDGTAPKASILRSHLGRIWCNDKENKDRVHYSGSFNHTQWLGFGDSAAIDIGVGDGDPDGIVAISPTFKGEIFVAKRTKLYRIRGFSPETFQVELISDGIGSISHNSFALIDQDDMVFVSERGIHSMNATANFGDFSGAFISKDIQKTFLSNFDRSTLKYCKAAYNPELNSVAFTFTDSNLPVPTNTTLTINNSVWLFNFSLKAWYRWADVPCQSLIVSTDGDKKRFYFGGNQDKIIQSATGNAYDIDYTGNNVGIFTFIKTGQIAVDGSLYTIKGFKRFSLYFRPESSHNIQVQCKIDNIPLDSLNEFTFNETAVGTLLGVDFILGESTLGSDAKLVPYNRTIDGFGRSIEITIMQTGVNETVEIQGFAIEWEPAGTSPEVR